MPKWFDDTEDFESPRGPKGHRQRKRRRKDWDDGAPVPEYVPPSVPERPAYRTPVAAPVSVAVVAERGTVRFYDATRGFGFVAPATGPDLFVHITVVRRSGLEELKQGQSVTFERGPGRQPGKEAVIRLHPETSV